MAHFWDEPAIEHYTGFGYPMPLAGPQVPGWRAVLAKCGYPLPVVVIDFETYFDPDYCMGDKAGALSTIEYVTDKRFEILGCGFTLIRQPFDDHRTNTHFAFGLQAVAERIDWLRGQYGRHFEGCTVLIQNASFDATILARHFSLYPPHVIDLLGLSRHQNARRKNDLAHICKYLGLEDKGDTSQFSGMTFRERYTPAKRVRSKLQMPRRRPLATGEQTAALCEYGRNDCLREWEGFTILLPQLTNPAVELQWMQHSLEIFTKPELRVDYPLGDSLKEQMRAAMNAAIPEGMTAEELRGDIVFGGELCKALEEAGDIPARYYKPGKKGYLLAIAADDPERELLENHKSDRVRGLMAGRIACDSWPGHIKRIEKIAAQCKAGGDKLPVPLRYYAAHTGRSGGTEKINLANLGSKAHPLITAVRGVLIPDVDKTLVITYASAIEARGLAWIAGQDDLITKFKNGEEIYCGFAEKVLGYRVRTPNKNGSIPVIEQRMGWARDSVGKVGILGCGYGMGAEKAVGYADGAIDLPLAEQLVSTYRNENKAIVKLWGDVERAFVYTARYRRACELPRGLAFIPRGNDGVSIHLPNGRRLHYDSVRLAANKFGRGADRISIFNNMKQVWEFSWGGSLVENIVQGFCRDILVEAILRLERRGYHTVLHNYDECVLHVPIADADKALAASIEELSREPAWAPGIPLAAKGQIAERYCK
jgi:DNA polymerase